MRTAVADPRTDPRPGGLSHQGVGELLWEVGAGERCPMARLLSAPLQQHGGMLQRWEQRARRGDGRSWWIQGNGWWLLGDNLGEELSRGEILFRTELLR